MGKSISNRIIRKIHAIVVIILATMQLSAQDLPVTIRINNVPVSDLLKAIESQSPYRFSYRNTIIKNKPKVSANFNNVPVKNILEKTLPPLQLEWKMTSEKNISIKKIKEAPKPNEIIFGADVKDDFLELPLPDAKVEILSADSTKIKDLEIVKYLRGKTNNITSTQVFTTLLSGKKYILHGSLDGYNEAWVNIDIPLETKEMVSKELRLRKAVSKELDEVTVTATKVKMYWKGDTIVYDASAFNLPEGSMLDDLIRQMPGVTLNDAGEIFVNGRKVDELLLGSKSFFRGRQQVLLKNLPYYTVKNIKVYEQSSELSKLLGYEATAKLYVMDVNLLEKYNQGITANLETGAGTKNRYLGRAFILGYNDIFRFSVAANANNVNENYHIKENIHGIPQKTDQSELTTNSLALDLKFDNKRIKDDFNVDFTYSTDRTEMTQRRETFLNGIMPLTDLSANTREKNHNLKMNNHFKIIKPWLLFDFDFDHRSFHSESDGVTEQRDSILITRITDIGHGKGKAWNLNGYISGSTNFNLAKRTVLNYSLKVEHEDEKSYSMRQYNYIVPTSLPLNNFNDYKYRNTKGSIFLNSILMTKGDLWLSVAEEVKLERSKKRDFLYHPDSISLPSQKDALQAITDISNSYESRLYSSTFFSSLQLRKFGLLPTDEASPIPRHYPIWNINFIAEPKIQSLHYKRGAIDTLVNSTVLTFRPEFELNIFPTGTYVRQFTLFASYHTDSPSLYDLIDYRDTRTPQIVKLGNSNLKGSQTTYTSVNFYSRGSYPTLLHIGAKFIYYHRAIAQSVKYDPISGITTYCPVNVKGNFLGNISFDINRSFGRAHQWTISDNTETSFENSVDHSLLQGETVSHINKVKTLKLHDGMFLQFNKGSLNVRASGDVLWHHSISKVRDFKTLNAIDFKYGLSVQYIIPILNIAFSADGNVFTRRGYGMQSLNINRLIINASVSKSFMKGKLVAKLACFDLLHQLSPSNYEINAQARIETSYHPLPQYIMLRLLYQFNFNPIVK